MTGGIVFLVIAVLGVMTLFKGVKFVPQGYEWTVERFGRYTHSMRPGLNIIVPFVDAAGPRR